MSFTASRLLICSAPRALSANGVDRRPSVPEASVNAPGSVPVATSSFTLRIRFPVRLSLTVPNVTRMSVAPNSSAGMPMS